MPDRIREAMIDHSLRASPLEACGLLADDGSGEIKEFYPIRNIEESTVRFTLEPEGQFLAFNAATERGWSICGVMHSHVGSEASPSPVDLAQPHDSEWLHLIVGLEPEPHMRAWRIIGGVATEIAVTYQPD